MNLKFLKHSISQSVCKSSFLQTRIRTLTENSKQQPQKQDNEKEKTETDINEVTDDEKKKTKLFTLSASKGVQVILDQIDRFREGTRRKEKEEERKGPFKDYRQAEERDKKQIMFYEEYFDKVAKKKDRENFMIALNAYVQTNPQKNLYIDFIYGALLKMKEYNAQNHREAYRKLMEIFPIGPLRCTNVWQVDNMHFPRHQNCAIEILEQMERNGVLLDEDFVRLAIKIFGDWTHVVRKAKRQLYWLPKFKHSNPFPLPPYEKFEKMNDLELALIALDRMCATVDSETKIKVDLTKDLEKIMDNRNEELLQHEHTWIATAQSKKQIELIGEHKKSLPIFIEGPSYTYVRSKLVEYYVMKTDPLEEILQKANEIEEFDTDNVAHMYNPFGNPYAKSKEVPELKVPELSPYEMNDGVIYAICCTGNGSKSSLYYWTKMLELRTPELKENLIIYRIKPKQSSVADMSKIKSEEKKL